MSSNSMQPVTFDNVSLDIQSSLPEDRLVDLQSASKLGIDARRAILDGATGDDYRLAVQSVLRAITANPALADENFCSGLFDRIRIVAGSPFADEANRSTSLDVMVRIEPVFSRIHLYSMFHEEMNGAFAVRETLRLSAEGETLTPLIPRQEVIEFMHGNLRQLMSEFSSLDGDSVRQAYIRTGMLNQAAFMSATGTVEGREFVEDLLNCRDYDLQRQLLVRLGNMEGQAVQSIYVIGEYRNNLERRFSREDAGDIAAIALASLHRIAEGYGRLSREEQKIIVPDIIVTELHEWLLENGLDQVAEFLKQHGSTR